MDEATKAIIWIVAFLLASGVIGLFGMIVRMSGIIQWQHMHEKRDDERMANINAQLSNLNLKLNGDNQLAKALTELAQVVKELSRMRN